MTLPPGFLDELRARLSLAQVVGRKVTWDARKSNQGRGDMWAPCPFHQEKTASFHVDDGKGFYYCFGCHAKGDAIGFVRETENVGFLEAVELLAREAGMAMPARDPEAARKAESRQDLAGLMDAALHFFRRQLSGAGAGPARDYLTGRRLTDAAIARFELGFAPDARQALWDHLRGRGIAPDRIAAAGLALTPEGGGAPYDRFRGRIMYPIRDARGRCVAFGARALRPDQQPKYLNSPQTDLFDKSRSLYNHGPARAAAGKGQTLLVAEGYMDVIALSEAGFEATVAALGTALTEAQLELLWRIAPEPVIAMDGDGAGLKAAMRVIDRALPLLRPGRSLRFAIMPAGLDPDDLIARDGAGAMRKLLDEARPMIALLWRRETEGRDFDSPERRAALEKALADVAARIADPAIRRHYQTELRRLQWTAFAPAKAQRRYRDAGRQPGTATPSPGARASRHASSDPSDEILEAVILAALLRAPDTLPQFLPALERIELTTDTHRALRDAILRCADATGGTLADRVAAIAGAERLDMFLAQTHLALTPGARDPGDAAIAALCIAEALAKLEARRGLAREMAEAIEDLPAGLHLQAAWRLVQSSDARIRAERGLQEDLAEYDTAPNGVELNRDEREAFGDLIRKIDFLRPRRR